MKRILLVFASILFVACAGPVWAQGIGGLGGIGGGVGGIGGGVGGTGNGGVGGSAGIGGASVSGSVGGAGVGSVGVSGPNGNSTSANIGTGPQGLSVSREDGSTSASVGLGLDGLGARTLGTINGLLGTNPSPATVASNFNSMSRNEQKIVLDRCLRILSSPQSFSRDVVALCRKIAAL